MKDKLSDINNVNFTELFDIEEIQKIQDSFAKSTGVASIITTPAIIPAIKKPNNA